MRVYAASVVCVAAGVCLLFAWYACQAKRRVSLRNVDHFHELPEAAAAIYAEGNGLRLASEFTITEPEFRKWAAKKGWRLHEIAEPVTVVRYGGLWAPGNARWHATVCNGLIYRHVQKNGSFVEVIFDREKGRAYYNYSRR